METCPRICLWRMSVWPWSCYMEAVHACKTAEGGFVFRWKAYATVMRAESENRAWQTRALGTRHLWTRSLVLSLSPTQMLHWQTDTQILYMLTHSKTKLWERASCILTGSIFRLFTQIELLGWECHLWVTYEKCTCTKWLHYTTTMLCKH